MNFKKEGKIKKIFTLVAIISLLGMIGYQIFPSLLDVFQKKIENKEEKNNNETIVNNQQLATNNQQSLTNSSPFRNQENEVRKEIELKKEIDLDVPFTPQAPYAVWDELHNEACEEAALVMVHYFFKGKELTKEIMEKEIQDLVDWQIKNWGEHKDLTLEEVGKLAKDYYGWQKIKIQDKITIEDIKKEISLGNPVIIPAAGRQLGNPYYRQPGPYYHMLVVRGYTKNKIITNDPGTKRGENYSYNEEVIYNAIHDWPGEDKDILDGAKKMLVIEK